MGLLQIEISVSRTERKPCNLHSFLHTKKEKYETVLTPKFATFITHPEDKIFYLFPS